MVFSLTVLALGEKEEAGASDDALGRDAWFVLRAVSWVDIWFRTSRDRDSGSVDRDVCAWTVKMEITIAKSPDCDSISHDQSSDMRERTKINTVVISDFQLLSNCVSYLRIVSER